MAKLSTQELIDAISSGVDNFAMIVFLHFIIVYF